ncbi:DUF5689 domain-containing protein [Chitinophaga agrisoli]|uniref:DUF5689 domain-containing protein n=1 Tax=Chitinophaga agrisoli TaxID=2607653 RepID=UPI0016619052|nr:DUF5689 domain-containing protein [Chitinophaga agrisoli]
MKQISIYSFLLLSLACLWGCKKDTYPGAELGPYISMFDVRHLYRGSEVTLNTDNMGGATKITGVVVSDHTGGNLPQGLLVLQDNRRLSQLRGISLPVGDLAKTFVPGDSIIVHVEGHVLKKVNGILEITGITANDIAKVSSGIKIPVNRVPINKILAAPDDYESTLSVIVKGGFDPLPAPKERLSGNKVLNDGFGNITLRTADTATFAGDLAPVSANFYGIMFNANGSDGKPVPEFRMRTHDDVQVLSSEIEIAPVVIAGFMSDLQGGDGNYEYVQLLATKDIDFSVTPFAVVVTNNANASKPGGFPAKGWATGTQRTFKFNLFSGKAAKGTYFYVGGANKKINGPNSTSIAQANWIRTFDYTKQDGDGFGAMTGGLFANSGNASGVAVFADSVVTVDSRPVDVIFVATGGSLFTAGPPAQGYRITNTDWYDVKNPLTLEDQPFYRAGSNTLSLVYNTADLGYYNLLGGEYSPTLGKWMKARTQGAPILSKSSALADIEGESATKLRQ